MTSTPTASPVRPDDGPAAGRRTAGRWRGGGSPSARRLLRAAAALLTAGAVVAGAMLALALTAAERGGVPHRPLLIDGRLPATLYVPGRLPPGLLGGLPDPRPVGARPPLVVLVHGHSADQNTMSGLARAIAADGYAALTIDLPGHGMHRESFQVAGLDGWRRDLGTVLDWARSSPHVDPDRVVLLGHSLGAAAVLDAAARDPRPIATIAIGGGPASLEPGKQPRNPFFLVAAADSPVVRAGAERAADAWATPQRPPLAVVPGTDHLGVLFSDHTAGTVLDWVHGTAGPGTIVAAPAGGADARPAIAPWYALTLLVLAPLTGWAAGRFVAPVGRTAPGDRDRGRAAGRLRATCVLAPAVAALVTLPWAGWPGIGAFLGLEAGGALVALLAAAGVVLLAAHPLALRAGLLPAPAPDRGPALRAAAAGAVVAGGLVLLLLPLTPMLHTPVPTPVRAVITLVATALLLPATLAMERWLCHGPPLRAALRSLAGRLLVLAGVLAGVFAGQLPGMLAMHLIALVPFVVLLELACAGLRATGRSGTAPAVAQAAALGWLIALLSPVLW